MVVETKLAPFHNEPFTDFTQSANKEAMLKALAKVKSELGRSQPLVIGKEKFDSPSKPDNWLVSTNPAKPSEVLARFVKASTQEAEKAMQVALNAFDSWKKVKAEKRAQILLDAALIMRKRKYELAAWMILEVGKSWAEADGDVAEAIDFCEFYAREMIRIANGHKLHPLPGEENKLSYIPLGVGLVIPPWNFPLAICVGMTTAALVAGNSVILKPSSESPAIAHQFISILEEVGLPPGVVTFLPGSGAEVGDYLVTHAKTRFIAFTGSKEVGLRINELAAKTQPKQIWIKRVIAEMGGKDSIVVDKDADIEKAADGIVTSAFGFQGQKCSACSRAIIHKDVYDQILEKVVAKTKNLKIGTPEVLENAFGPVASKSAYESILKYIEIGKGEGKVVAGGAEHKNDDKGFYIQPTVIADIKPEARISQEEIFGPVLAFIKADSFDHAIEIANNTEFGLTGAVYSASRKNLEKAADDFHAGNLYLNRKCTGALVGVHPFGGFNMSGTDSKAGGQDYLLLFTQAKVVSEKV